MRAHSYYDACGFKHIKPTTGLGVKTIMADFKNAINYGFPKTIASAYQL